MCAKCFVIGCEHIFEGRHLTTPPFLFSGMKSVEHFAMRLAVLADDFRFMQNNAAIVLADGRVEEETANKGIALDDKVLSTTVIKVVPEELAERMPLHLIHCGNSLMC